MQFYNHITSDANFIMKLFISILSLSVLTESAIKTWTDNTNFDNFNNWNLKRIPKESDVAIMTDSEMAIFMPKSLIVKELLLPVNGMLVFPTNGEMRLSESNLPSEDITFIGGRSSYWYDPKNWNVTSPEAINVVGDKDSFPIPHSEQVPCQQDDIIFPIDTTFRILFDVIPLQMRSISINGKLLRSSNVRDFLTSDMGKLLFVNPPDITLTEDLCNNPSGCACENDKPQIKSKICIYAAPKCPKPKCADPITPQGHCCSICGSSIILTYKEGFTWNTMKQLFLMYIKKPEFQSVQGYISKTYDAKIQMIFTDAGREKGLAANLAGNIHAYLQQDIADLKMYNLTSTTLKVSSNWYSGDDVIPPVSQSLQGSAGKTVGIILAIFIGAAILLALFMMYKKRRIPGFAFARFDSDGSRIEVELGTTPHAMLDPSSSSILPVQQAEDKGFDNPVYDKSMTSLENQSYIEEITEGKISKTTETRENPMFMILDEDGESSDLVKY
ncbi:protein amnionless-like isoform X2 [Centruroides sculpturatus]|uniref:protein amnionless-like isoform X2 n=1 Tax=Centruroides sculpturatus TaxID=218467 RepID=UPI000C6DD486|nr:protein amnionless-like isoform X2 [Centruroides sculpturatus]